MKYSVIVAVDLKYGFSKNNKIPWHYPEDLQHFRKLTQNGICVMGRHTYEEINTKMQERNLGNDSVLPTRQCFVLSNTLTSLPNATVIKSLTELEAHIPYDSHVFLIGGQSIFDVGLDVADIVHISKIFVDYDCDQFFDIDKLSKNFTLLDNNFNSNMDLTFMTFVKNS